MATLPLAEIQALKGVFRDAATNFQRVGERIYEGGANPRPKFDGNYFEDGFWGGLHLIPEVDRAGSPTPVIVGFDPVIVRYRRRSWRGAVRYLWEQQYGDKIGYYAKLAKSLAEALMYTRELVAHEPLNRGMDSTYLGGWDNKPLLDTTHPLLSGSGTFSNRRTYASPSQSVLEDIQLYFNTVPDPYGRPIVVPKITLVVPSAQEYTWRQLLNTTTAISRVEGNTLSSSINPNPNIVSVVESGRFTLLTTPYLFYNPNTSGVPQVYYALGAGHELFLADAFLKTKTWEMDDPDAVVHRVWWSGAVGWRSAERVLGYV